MSLKCIIGLHSWNGCSCKECSKIRSEQHDWSKDCEKCAKCGESRDSQHDWSKDCEKCAKCEESRDNQHDWNGVLCVTCGKYKDHKHDWSKNCQSCSICGQHRLNQHNWEKDCEKCSFCEKTRSECHRWNNGRCTICGKGNGIIQEYSGWSKKDYVWDYKETSNVYQPSGGKVKCEVCYKIVEDRWTNYGYTPHGRPCKSCGSIICTRCLGEPNMKNFFIVFCKICGKQFH